MKIINFVYNLLIGLNGILLVSGIYGIATFLGIIAILYSATKMILVKIVE